MASQALITRPSFGPPCPFGSASFGGALAFPPARGMLAMLAFQVVRSAAYYLLSRDPSCARWRPARTFQPPWMRWQPKPQTGNEENSLLHQRMKSSETSEKQVEVNEAREKQLILVEKAEDSTTGKPLVPSEAELVTSEDTLVIASVPSLEPKPPTLASLTPMLMSALANLRTTASSLQTLLASHERLATAPATGYIREALMTVVWVCDIVDVVRGMAKTKA